MADTCKFCGSPDLFQSETAKINVFGVEQILPIPEGQAKPIVCNTCNRTQNLEAYFKTLLAMKTLILSNATQKAS
jgi:hypothetical protein